MAQVRKATIDLFDRIYPLIETFAIQGLSRDDWYRLLSSSWFSGHDHFGYVLVDGEEVVGFLGVFFYRRYIEGVAHDLASFFCWNVRKQYRRESLLLLRPVLTRKDLTVTSLTPSREATLIWDRFQFGTLEDTLLIFPLLPAPSLFSRAKLIADPDRIQEMLDDEQRKFFTDHRLPTCSHLLIQEPTGSRYCYIVYNRVRKKGLNFTQLCFVSNPALLAACFVRVMWFFFRNNRTVFTLVDSRLMAGVKTCPRYAYRLRYPRRFRSENLQPGQIDNLYSELPLLKMV